MSIPDEAFVVRGGTNLRANIQKKIATHPSGIIGVSVHSAIGVSILELAQGIPNGQIGITTVGEIRKLGGDVIRTSGRSPYHATLTGLSAEQISFLFTPTIPNPSQKF